MPEGFDINFAAKNKLSDMPYTNWREKQLLTDKYSIHIALERDLQEIDCI